MAGTRPGFNAAAFRDNIRFAMNMGAPPDAGERATFHFQARLIYAASADGSDTPFDPATTVVRETPAPVQVDCAVEYFDAQGQPTNFGLLAPSRVAVTLLDEDYTKVKDCAYVVIHGDRYEYQRTEPPTGMFDVGVYTLHFKSQSET